MIDRTINLIAVFILLLILTIAVDNIINAWFETEPWEQSWIAIENVKQTHPSGDLVKALKNAQSQHQYSDANKIREILERTYKPSGEISTRFNSSEVEKIMTNLGSKLLLLFIPFCLNYIHHGNFRFWNKSV